MAAPYLVGSTMFVLRLRTTRRPRGTDGKASTNSTDDPGELFLFAFPSVAFSIGGISFQLSRRCAARQTIEPFLLQLRRWEEGGVVGGCRLVADNSGTMPCVPAEDFQSAEVPEQLKFFQEVKTLPALEDFVLRTAPGHRAPCRPCRSYSSPPRTSPPRQAKGLYRLKHVGALGIGLAYLSRYNSGWFYHSSRA
jgi:hypothetical protein